MNDESGFSDGFGAAFVMIGCGVIVFALGSVISYYIGQSVGEKNMALLTVQAINKIEKQLSQGTKIQNPFTEEVVKDLGYDAQDVLKLLK